MFKRHDPIKPELIKMFGVVALVTLLAVWQSHFIIEGVLSNVYLNGVIFGAAFFGIYNVFSQTFSLSNEHVALSALREQYDDALRAYLHPEDDRSWRYFRLSVPAVVYTVPTVLGHAHNLILEEINRTGFVRIPASTMKMLVEDIENKLDDKTSLTTYMGALMVLLGLMGTFIGLMETLASVGGILGSLNLGGGAGPEAIQGLIEGLKKPLNGMATGFSSSLFGLLGSLVIGLLAKLDSVAVGKFKHEFEDFIGKVAQIEASDGTRQAALPAGEQAEAGAPRGATGVLVSASEANHLRLMMRVARTTVTNTARMAEQIEALAAAVESLRTGAEEHKAETRNLTAAIDRSLAIQVSIGTGVVAESRQTAAAQTRLLDAVDRLETAVSTDTKGRAAMTGAITAGFQNLDRALAAQAQRLSELRSQTSTLEATVTAQGHSTAADLASLKTSTRRSAEDDTSRLLADIDAVLASSRLLPSEVARLKVLSDLLSEPPAGGIEDLRQRLASIWPEQTETADGQAASDDDELFTSSRSSA
ncbi:hypothetical protein [Chthonobacter albigriseus]|uniref:hypothetical protein n=1 Tax=Chthonobacter albigriseus TaxID=1683161 RepID=UPI0015EE9C64|nr:hypothetical protein [Chthonobacter albigriseus]